MRNRAIVRAAKSRPCVDCGGAFPWYVMQFDHVRGTKLGDINRLVSMARNESVILAEIEKCEIVCANCHSARTYLRGLIMVSNG